MVFLINGAVPSADPYRKTNSSWPLSYTIQKKQYQMEYKSTYENKILKLLEENIGKCVIETKAAT